MGGVGGGMGGGGYILQYIQSFGVKFPLHVEVGQGQDQIQFPG